MGLFDHRDAVERGGRMRVTAVPHRLKTPHNFRDRFGLIGVRETVEVRLQRRGHIVEVSVELFGSTGPWKRLAVFACIYFAEAGLPEQIRELSNLSESARRRRVRCWQRHLFSLHERRKDRRKERVRGVRPPHHERTHTTRFQNPMDLAQSRRDIPEIHQPQTGDDSVERVVGKGQLVRIGNAKLNVGDVGLGRVPASDLQHALGQIGGLDRALRSDFARDGK